MSNNGSGNPAKIRIEKLVPLGAVLEVDRGTILPTGPTFLHDPRLWNFPAAGWVPAGGCRVQVVGAALTPRRKVGLYCPRREVADGWRLACRAHAESPLKLKVEQWNMPVLTDDTQLARTRRTGLVVAIDLGTTTVVAQLLDLATEKNYLACVQASIPRPFRALT